MKTFIITFFASYAVLLAQTINEKSDSPLNIKTSLDSTKNFLNAASSNDVETIKLLLNRGVNVNVKSSEGETALLNAAWCGSVECIQFLLNQGANINAKYPDGSTALFGAVSCGKFEAFKLLLDKGADINAKTSEGETILMRAASSTVDPYTGLLPKMSTLDSDNKIKMVKLLLDKGADVNAKTKDGETALLRAAWGGSVEICRILLGKGANISNNISYYMEGPTSHSSAQTIDYSIRPPADGNSLRMAWGGFEAGKILSIAISASASVNPLNPAVASGTNTDSSGYVTNAALLTPFTLTNSTGDVITNAVLVKLTPNKFIYKSPGGGGMLRLDSLSIALQKRFGYDPKAAQAADEVENQKKVLQQEIDQQQREADYQQAQFNTALKNAMLHRVLVMGKVIQKIDAGLLVSDGGTEDVGNPIVLIKNYPNYKSVASDDYVNCGRVFPVGLYSYTTVRNSENTIHAFTCSTNVAVAYYLSH